MNPATLKESKCICVSHLLRSIATVETGNRLPGLMILESVNFAVAPRKCESAVIKLWKFNLQGVYTLRPNLSVNRTDIIARS